MMTYMVALTGLGAQPGPMPAPINSTMSQAIEYLSTERRKSTVFSPGTAQHSTAIVHCQALVQAAGCPPPPHTAVSQAGHSTAPPAQPSRPATCNCKLLTSWASLPGCPASELAHEPSEHTCAGCLSSASLSPAAGFGGDPANLQDTDSLASQGLMWPKVCSRQPEAPEARLVSGSA